jgi:hypothetical protein
MRAPYALRDQRPRNARKPAVTVALTIAAFWLATALVIGALWALIGLGLRRSRRGGGTTDRSQEDVQAAADHEPATASVSRSLAKQST